MEFAENIKLTPITLANFTANGSIGTAPTTVDLSSYIKLNQTTAGISVTIPTPTDAVLGTVLYITNIGTQSININTIPLASTDTITFIYTGTAWKQDGSSFKLLNVISFSATGTYTPTVGMKYCIVEAVGGGGGSGGCNAGSVTAIVVSGGGGGGGYAKALYTSTQIGASQLITIGTAGAAGTTVAGGGNGGNTLFGIAGSLMSCNGGTGGVLGTQAGNFPVQAIQGGLGGISTVSTGQPILLMNGESADPSYGSLNGLGTALMTGNGGSSMMGVGGRGTATFFNNTGAGGTVGVTGIGSGAGASGSSTSGTGSPTRLGAAGTAGRLIITEYFN